MTTRQAEHVETYYAPLGLWGMNSIYPFRDGVAIVSRDISAQKLLENRDRQAALRPERIDLDAVAAEIIETIQSTADRHRIVLSGSVPRPVRADHDRIGQVLDNLLTNAIKYSPGANEILVRLGGDAHSAVVEVEDFGIGMDKEHLARVFDRFYRVSSPDEKTFPGLGIGLYISHEIVRRHGGTLRVKSTKGRGSVFRFTVPYDDGEDRTEQPEDAPA